MTRCYPNPIHFSSVQCRKVEAEFSGGAITGNGGIPLLAEVDQQLGLTRSVSKYLGDARRQARFGGEHRCRICSGSACMHWLWDMRT